MRRMAHRPMIWRILMLMSWWVMKILRMWSSHLSSISTNSAAAVMDLKHYLMKKMRFISLHLITTIVSSCFVKHAATVHGWWCALSSLFALLLPLFPFTTLRDEMEESQKGYDAKLKARLLMQWVRSTRDNSYTWFTFFLHCYRESTSLTLIPLSRFILYQ